MVLVPQVDSLPSWALWSRDAAVHPWTVGVEEEIMLLDPRRWTLANRVGDLRPRLPASLAHNVAAETHACVMELATAPHATAAATGEELAYLRRELAATVRDITALEVAAAGTHPSASWPDVAVSPGPRYRLISTSMRALARREPTCALHVHVAVPESAAAMRAYEGLRAEAPLLIALAANSPFWQGRDTGLASARTPIFSMFPRVGMPRSFTGYDDYVDAVEALLRCGAVPDPSFLWWDIRLRPQLGTVEVRVMDAQARAIDAAALAALVQCRVRVHAESESVLPRPTPEVLHENRFLAARDGMQARLIDPATGSLRAAHALLADMLSDCAPVVAELRCGEQLDDVARLAGDPGYARQRELAAARGLGAVLPALSEEFSPVGRGEPLSLTAAGY